MKVSRKKIISLLAKETALSTTEVVKRIGGGSSASYTIGRSIRNAISELELFGYVKENSGQVEITESGRGKAIEVSEEEG